MKHVPYGPYEKYIKRPLDCVLATGALVVLSPIMGVTAVAVRKKLGTPVIFSQERPGRIDSGTGKETIFKLFKFKSMLDPQTMDGRIITDEERTELIARGEQVLSDEARLTKFGRTLRATSLDELPELVNIIRGDMSIVGPRPLSTAYLPYYTDRERLRHSVRPGLTGLAQINGRNSVTWEDKFRYDVDYSEKITFIGDVKILLKTIGTVLKRDNIGQGEETPESFHIVRQREIQEETTYEH